MKKSSANFPVIILDGEKRGGGFILNDTIALIPWIAEIASSELFEISFNAGARKLASLRGLKISYKYDTILDGGRLRHP